MKQPFANRPKLFRAAIIPAIIVVLLLGSWYAWRTIQAGGAADSGAGHKDAPAITSQEDLDKALDVLNATDLDGGIEAELKSQTDF